MIRSGRSRRIAGAALLGSGLLLATEAAAGLLAGARPEGLGLRDGRLAPCPPTPNCVSSFVEPAVDPVHGVAPLQPRGDAATAFSRLADWIAASERVVIVRRDADYLHAEYTSKVMGFVDDLELVLDRRANLIQVRSASRLGRSDLGVNRERVESLRAKLAELLVYDATEQAPSLNPIPGTPPTARFSP